VEVLAVDEALERLHTGFYLMDVGRDEDARRCFERAIEADSFMMDVHQWAHACLLRIEKDPEWYQRMNRSPLPK